MDPILLVAAIVTIVLIVAGGLAWRGQRGSSLAETERSGTNTVLGLKLGGGDDGGGGDGGGDGD